MNNTIEYYRAYYDDARLMKWRELSAKDKATNIIALYSVVSENSMPTVADLGCGDGALSYLIARAGAQVYGVDPSENGIMLAKEMLLSRGVVVHLTRALADRLPFPDNAFEVVICSDVIEHIQKPIVAVKEMARVAPFAVLTTPFRLTEVPQDTDDLREYFPGELEVLLKTAYQRVQIYLTHPLFFSEMYNYAPNWLGKRCPGRWLLNAASVMFGINPFLWGPSSGFRYFGLISAVAHRD